MFPLKKGKTTVQAHVGIPDGTFEEEHGRKGFYGKSPTSTTRIRRPAGSASRESSARTSSI